MMKARVNTITKAVLSVGGGEDRYPEDPPAVISISVAEPFSGALEHYQLNAAGNGIERRPQAQIDAIEAQKAEVEARPTVALGKIKAQLAALLAETDAQTMSRANALDLAGAKSEIGKIEVLLKHMIRIMRCDIDEEVSG